MNLDKAAILKEAGRHKELRTQLLVEKFGVSRQYASRLLSTLVDEGLLMKIGGTKNAYYVLPSQARREEARRMNEVHHMFKTRGLEEDRVFERLERGFAPLRTLSPRVRQIFRFAFSEMLNNAIEHAHSKTVSVRVGVDRALQFEVRDHGIGIFQNILHKRKLDSELEAIQDLLKGKTTTMPERHSGEGIFFTSKLADVFTIESGNSKLIIDNTRDDVFLETLSRKRKGTLVHFSLSLRTKKEIQEIFRRYTNQHPESDYGFDKTEVRVKLYALGDEHISRSQARRILAGLEKFKVIVFDFAEVRLVGQGFADEIFRVFQKRHPGTRLEVQHADPQATFMIDRARR